jgi:hypothetical protein
MTAAAKTVLFWITTFLTAVLLYRTVQGGSSGRALSSLNLASVPVGRLGIAELLVVLVIAVIVFAPMLADRQRFNSLSAKFNKTFNKAFFVLLTVILAIFTLADLSSH